MRVFWNFYLCLKVSFFMFQQIISQLWDMLRRDLRTKEKPNISKLLHLVGFKIKIFGGL